MVVLGFSPIVFLKWMFLVCLISSSMGENNPSTQPCDPNDLLVLQEFARTLKNGSIISSWSNKTSCCIWEGVFCGNEGPDSASGKVIMLVLPEKGLEGKIPTSLGRLDRLKVLDLSNNNLQGGLPVEFCSLTHLQVLDLSGNVLSGPVSGSLSCLKSIVSLNISSNSFTGDLFELSGFPDLVVLNVSSNSFNGRINSELCGLSSKIQIIDFSMNHVTGNIDGLRNCSRSLRQLHAGSNSLAGELPESLYSLSELEELSIYGNYFSGRLSENLSKLSKLKYMLIYQNRFSGNLPNVFGNLTELEQLLGYSNLFSGSLPSTLTLCSKLVVLNLRNNSLSGSIDLNFTGLPNLCTLDLATNEFTGSLPDSLSNCRKLKVLSVAKNELTGPIPIRFSHLESLLFLSLSNNSFVDLSGALSVFCQLKNLTTVVLTKNFINEEMPQNVSGSGSGFEGLKILALGNCGIRGKIPGWLSKCRKLQVLDLSWNRLNGNIPSWVGQMENLFYFDVSNNTLTGEIPRSLTELKRLISTNCSLSNITLSGIPLFVKRNQSASGLQYNQASNFPPAIYLSNNRINGMILPEIGRLKQLHILDLSQNNITGNIPTSISDMENLEVLDLSRNDLDGSIPPSFEKLTFLSRFSVAYNNLNGAIPTGGQFYSFPRSSFIGNAGLCRAIDSPCDIPAKMMTPLTASPGASTFSRSSIIGITVSVGFGIILLLAAIMFQISRRDNDNDGMVPSNDLDEEDPSRSWPRGLSESIGSSKLVLFQNSECKDLTVVDLLKSTNNFNQANIIGCGGFGLVYKAEFPNNVKAAIKRLSGDCGQMEREFRAEVESLSRAQHKNLVSLRGYCQHGNDRLLIYSYMENGSLDYWLHENVDSNSVLKWVHRLKIARGAARGLAYLHKVCEPHIVHRDVKSSNILLDEDFEAHLADFGLSRLLCPYDTHVTTDLVGTLGYIPPEYSQTLTATCRGDVYSFGVVLLELVTGRRPVEVCKGKNCRNLVFWAFEMKSEKKEVEILDVSISDKDNETQMLEMFEISCKCLHQDPRRRPLVEEVVSLLDGIGTEMGQE